MRASVEALFYLQTKGNVMVDDKVITDVVTDDDEPDGSKTYDAEYVKKLKAEAKEYRQAKAAEKKEKEEIKAKLDALEAEKLTATEKDKKKIAELEKQLADITGSIKAAGIDNLILKNAAGKNFVDIDTVSMLVKKELEAEEEVNDATVVKVIDNLIKTKPFLISSGNVNPSSGNFSKQDGDPVKDANAAMVEFLKS